MNARLACLFGCLVMFSASYAGNIYTWVDEAGRRHVSDTVPPSYQGVATKVDISASKLSEQQHQEALERLAREKEQLEAAGSARVDTQSSKDANPTPVPVLSPAPVAKESDCQSRMRAYRESQECFAPFMRVDGGIREEAFQYCKPIADPSTECGIPSEQSPRY